MRAHSVMRSLAAANARLERCMENWEINVMETQIDMAVGRHQGLLDYTGIDIAPKETEKSGLTDAEGLGLSDPLGDTEGETEGLMLALGEADSDSLTDMLGLALALGDTEGLALTSS